jgi:hypothetical protein
MKRWAIYDNKRKRVGHVDTNGVMTLKEAIIFIAEEVKSHELAYFDEMYSKEAVYKIGDTWYTEEDVDRFSMRIVKK